MRYPDSRIFLAFVVLFSCGNPDTVWQASTDLVDGVPHTYNPRTPMWGSEVTPFRLVEVLGSGSSEDRVLFARPLALATGRDGTRYVLDQTSRTVWMLNSRGEEIGSFGRSGEGPGEFGNPVDLAVLPHGSVAVLDPWNLRISIFDPEGRFLRAVPIRERFGQFEPAGSDQFFLYRRDRTNSPHTMGPEMDPATPQIVLLDGQGDPDTAFAPRHGVTGEIVDIYVNKLFLGSLPGDSILLSYQGMNRAEVWSPEGSLARVFHRPPPFDLQPPVYEEQLDPSGRPGMVGFEYDILSSGLAVHPSGRFWVVLSPQGQARVRTVLLGGSEIPQLWSLDLFDSGGRWLARQRLDFPCPHALLDWGSDGLYLLNPEADAVVYRFDFNPPEQ